MEFPVNHGVGCGCHSYEHGPTVCAAHPDVMDSIQQQIEEKRIMSLADSRMAERFGMLNIPPFERSGFNDGVVYAPDDVGPSAMAALAMAQPTAQFAMRRTTGTVTTLGPEGPSFSASRHEIPVSRRTAQNAEASRD